MHDTSRPTYIHCEEYELSNMAKCSLATTCNSWEYQLIPEFLWNQEQEHEKNQGSILKALLGNNVSFGEEISHSGHLEKGFQKSFLLPNQLCGSNLQCGLQHSQKSFADVITFFFFQVLGQEM